MAERLRATGRAVLLDVHSYPAAPLPYERHADGARPAVCLGTDPAHTPSWLVGGARRAFTAVGEVALDTPFTGTHVPAAHHGADPRVLSLMVEIRRDTHLGDPVCEPAVVRALADLVDGACELDAG